MQRGTWRVVALGAAAMAVLAGTFLVVRRQGPLQEAVELAGSGGERLLRPALRPATPGPRVLLFALDGVGEDTFFHGVRTGTFHHIQRLLGEPRGGGVYAHGYAVPGALSILPSTTVAAWSSVYTGEPPARTGVPGNEWFARDEGRYYAPAPVTVHGTGDALRALTDGLVGQALKVPTLFERAGVRAFVSLAQVYRGADLFTTPEPADLADLLLAFGEGVAGDETVEREAYSTLDREAVDSVLEALGRHGIPRLQVVYLPGVDLFTHVALRPLEDERRYLREVIDPLVGQVLDAYARRGVLDDTYVLFVSDHGHTPVLNDDRHALSAEGEDEPGALLAQQGFRLRPPRLELTGAEQDFQAALASQGALAYVYLADRSTCPERGQRCDWSRPPRLEEDVLPVARAFHRATTRGEGVPALQGTLDLVLAREGRPVGEDALPFQVFDGERLVPLPDFLARHPRPDLLRLQERLEALAVGPWGHRAGDVLLLARSGMEHPIGERFYFAGTYRSWHGSPSAQDSRIPLVVAHRGSRGEALRERVTRVVGRSPSQLHVTALVLTLLRGP